MRHQFFFQFLPKSCLLGFSLSQHETKLDEDDENWYPIIEFEMGLIFIKFSYGYISK